MSKEIKVLIIRCKGCKDIEVAHKCGRDDEEFISRMAAEKRGPIETILDAIPTDNGFSMPDNKFCGCRFGRRMQKRSPVELRASVDRAVDIALNGKPIEDIQAARWLVGRIVQTLLGEDEEKEQA